MSRALNAMLSAQASWSEDNVGQPESVRMSGVDFTEIMSEISELIPSGAPVTLYGMNVTVEPQMKPGEFAFRRAVPEGTLPRDEEAK